MRQAVHLFDANDSLMDAIFGQSEQVVEPTGLRPAMVEFAMPVWGLLEAVRRRALRRYVVDLCRARFATFSLSDVLPCTGPAGFSSGTGNTGDPEPLFIDSSIDDCH